MIHDAPRWTYESPTPLTQWYGHVQLLSERALGQWFCVDRDSGNLLWRRTYFRFNTVCGVESGVIVASEMRSDGPWTAAFGCYGVSLDDGRLLWTSHATGFWNLALRALDFVPGYTNEFRDHPLHVCHGEVICSSGRVLDPRTGAIVRRILREEVQALENPPSLERRLYDGERVRVAEGLTLFRPDGSSFRSGAWEMAAENDEGETLWRISQKSLARMIDGNFYSYRLAGKSLYLILSEEPATVPHPTKPHYALPNPTRWHLVTIDVATGEVVQDVRMDDEKHADCRIEDLDATGVLISSDRELKYFERREHGRGGSPSPRR